MKRLLFLLCSLPARYYWCWIRRHQLTKAEGPVAMRSKLYPGRIRTFVCYDCDTCQTINGKATWLGEGLYPPETLPLTPYPEGDPI